MADNSKIRSDHKHLKICVFRQQICGTHVCHNLLLWHLLSSTSPSETKAGIPARSVPQRVPCLPWLQLVSLLYIHKFSFYWCLFYSIMTTGRSSSPGTKILSLPLLWKYQTLDSRSGVLEMNLWSCHPTAAGEEEGVW